MELQDQIDNLESQSEIKEKKLKKLEDDNRILLKRLRENKTDKSSATSKTDNVNTKLQCFRCLHALLHTFTVGYLPNDIWKTWQWFIWRSTYGRLQE